MAAAGISAVTLRKGIDWGAPDVKPVDLLFMIAVPPQAQSDQLQILARLVNLISDEELVKALRNAEKPEDFIELLRAAETERFA